MLGRCVLVLILLATVAASCDNGNGAGDPPPPTSNSAVPTTTASPQTTTSVTEPGASSPEGTVELLVPEVLSIRPHDPEAFTQGLLIEDGRLFESTGRYGSSTLREVDPATGAVLRSVAVDDSLFAEGLELVGDRLVMLTFREGTAIVFERDSFEAIGKFSYPTEGWGLCFDGERLVMSDGTPTLVFRDPGTFAEIDRLTVTIGGERAERINELECVDGEVWANIWRTDLIYRIDPTSGDVTGVVDASALLAEPLDEDGAVLNGIAFDETSGSWLVTGKLWPSMFEVRFVPAGSTAG
jgi:glutaminyl-peptide cyclotransferase